MDVWMPIPKWEHYEASESGHIRTLAYHGNKRKKPRLLSPARSRAGYLRVLLYRDGFRRSVSVHVLVLEAFKGDRPKGLHGAHLDGNSLNNRISNLAWVTPKENMRQRGEHGRTRHGIAHHSCVLSEDQVRAIRELHKNGMNCYRIAKDYPIGESSILKIVRWISWKHVV